MPRAPKGKEKAKSAAKAGIRAAGMSKRKAKDSIDSATTPKQSRVQSDEYLLAEIAGEREAVFWGWVDYGGVR